MNHATSFFKVATPMFGSNVLLRVSALVTAAALLAISAEASIGRDGARVELFVDPAKGTIAGRL